MFNEFDHLFADIFNKRAKRYLKIVHRLALGKATLNEIAIDMGRQRGGDVAEALKDLGQAGFVHRDYTWSLKTKEKAKTAQYRLSDNYIRFYMKYIEPHREKILEGTLKGLPPGWEGIMGYQFENLVLKSRDKIFQLLAISPDEILWAAPFLQRKTRLHSKCQIDLLIQTKFNTLYVCQIKFEKGPLGFKIVDEMKERVGKLSIPRGFSVRPVLIHVNGVYDGVMARDYFASIIDFSSLLQT